MTAAPEPVARVTRRGCPRPIRDAVSWACTKAEERDDKPEFDGSGCVERMGIEFVSVR